MPQKTTTTNYWSSSENNRNNSWVANFSSGNTWNNNKYNRNRVRAVSALDYGFEDCYQSIIEAYNDCLRGKMQSAHAQEYMYIAHRDLYRLATEIYNGTYQPSTSTCFLVKYPRLREVFAANFRDRIIHHWLFSRLNPLFERRHISNGNVSHNCRTGFGVSSAVASAEQGLSKVSCDYTKKAYVFKGDITSFFMSINKQLLLELVTRFINRHYRAPDKHLLLQVTRTTILHDPSTDCIFNTDTKEWSRLEPRKSLFRTDKNHGLAIGNLSTQIFANFLLSYLDSYVLYLARHHNCSYVRFVDDFILASDNLAFIKSAIPKIESFLRNRLDLVLHPRKRYLQPVSHGVTFVGATVKPRRTYLNNRTLARFAEKMHGFNLQLQPPNPTPNIYDLEHIQSVINSYLGFCKDKRCYKIKKSVLVLSHPAFYTYFCIRGHYGKIVIRKPYQRIGREFN